MNISEFCIKHKVTTLLAFIMISIFGVVFTTQLQLALLPDVEAPMAVVACYYNGASPSDMEELVTRPLEGAIMSVSGVESISSTSSDGMSQIQITYVEGTNLDIAATKLREKFNTLSLPDGAIDPMIINMNIGDLMPTAMVALMGEDLAEVQALADETVVPALERIEALAQSRKTAKMDETSFYSPDQYAICEDGRIVTEGLYLAFIVSPEADALEKTFLEAVK